MLTINFQQYSPDHNQRSPTAFLLLLNPIAIGLHVPMGFSLNFIHSSDVQEKKMFDTYF